MLTGNLLFSFGINDKSMVALRAQHTAAEKSMFTAFRKKNCKNGTTTSKRTKKF